MRIIQLAILAVAVLSVTACEGELEGEEVGCPWFQGSNCWKSSVEAARACAPDPATAGTLAADGKSCSYASGHKVTFVLPIDLASGQLAHDWDIEIHHNGTRCVAYTNRDDRIALTTPNGTFEEVGRGGSMGITCPDGLKYKVSNTSGLMSCKPLFSTMPGHMATNSSTAAALTLLGVTNKLELFDCALP